MSITETRTYPVAFPVVMRASLFALANMQAQLQAYNEETGVIVATLSKWLGVQKNEVVVRVREFEQTAVLELEAPDASAAKKILELVSTYVLDGSKIKADAAIQWVDVAKQQTQKAKRQQIVNKARSLLPGNRGETETAVVATPNDIATLVPATDETQAVIYIPENPGVLVKNFDDRMIELKVDTDVFTDRTAFLELCPTCSATVMRGSRYCAVCATPQTLEAVQPEMADETKQAANAGLVAGLIALGTAVLPWLIMLLPPSFGQPESFLRGVADTVGPLSLAASLLLGLIPSIGFAMRAILKAQRAFWFINLSANFETAGRTKATAARLLGWICLYLCGLWIVFVLIVSLLG